MGVTLDLSPMLVNRTAAFHICRAVADALTELQPSYQYMGEVFAHPPQKEAVERLSRRLEDLLARPGEADRRPALTVSTDAAQDARCVFLDPLYVLFCELSERDVVLVHDLSPVTTPAWHRAEVATLYDLAFASIARVGPQLVSVSHNSAHTYHANYGYPRRSIRIIPLFVPDHVHPGSGPLQAPRPYFLFVGSLEVRKNVRGAIEAFRLSGLAAQGYDLLVVGGHGHHAELALKAGGATPGVVFHGFVDDAEIAGVYEGATGFLYPSYLEGFGVPLLEALLHGVPAVASITGASPEVGGDLVTYCDPDDHVALAWELRRIAAMSVREREDFGNRARRRAAEQFSLESFQVGWRDVVQAP